MPRARKGSGVEDVFVGGSHGFQGNGGGSVVRGTTELTANELPTRGDRTNFKELYGRSGKFDRD